MKFAAQMHWRPQKERRRVGTRRRVFDPTTRQSAFCRVVDRLVVQCRNAGFIYLRDSASHSLIEATLPEVLLAQVATFQRGANPPGGIANSRIEHSRPLLGVKVQVAIADDG